MDRFLNNVVDDKEANERPSLRTTSREKKARSRVCLDIGRFFYENAGTPPILICVDQLATIVEVLYP